jgi:HAMP domain-containing protein
MTALQAFAATLALLVLLDRSVVFAWRRITRPVPRIEDPR